MLIRAVVSRPDLRHSHRDTFRGYSNVHTVFTSIELFELGVASVLNSSEKSSDVLHLATYRHQLYTCRP
jgi:hypothetical protein